jgi:transposase
MAYIKKIKVGDSIYLAKVESYRQDGKVKQRFIEYVGKEVEGVPVQKVDINKVNIESVKTFAEISILFQLCQQLKLDILLGRHSKAIIALLISNLLCKGSITKIGRWIENSDLKSILGIESISTDQLYNALEYLEQSNFNTIEHEIFLFWKKLCPSDSEAFVHDVTDTYYNGKHDETKPRKGKDSKVSKLVQVGLAVTFNSGFPIFHKTYSGTISNIKILEDLLAVMAERGINTVVLDRGFYSEANVEDMKALGMNMIVGMKKSIGLKNNVIPTIDKESLYSKKYLIELQNTIVYAKEIKYLFGKLIVIYNPKYEVMKKDHMLMAGATDKEVKDVGFSFIFHNTKFTTSEVVKKYFDKDIVERSFKMMKQETSLHPIRFWMPSKIKAHVKLCYLSMCLLSLMKFRCSKLNLQASEILKELSSIYKVNLKNSINNTTFTKIVTATTKQTKIIKNLKCKL